MARQNIGRRRPPRASARHEYRRGTHRRDARDLRTHARREAPAPAAAAAHEQDGGGCWSGEQRKEREKENGNLGFEPVIAPIYTREIHSRPLDPRVLPLTAEMQAGDKSWRAHGPIRRPSRRLFCSRPIRHWAPFTAESSRRAAERLSQAATEPLSRVSRADSRATELIGRRWVVLDWASGAAVLGQPGEDCEGCFAAGL